MSEISDAFDLAVSAILVGFMLLIGVWCIAAYKSSYVRIVDEKTAVTNVETYLDTDFPLTEYYGRDCLAALMVNDSYVPEPNKVTFQTSSGSTIYTATYDTAWFREKEGNLLNAYSKLNPYKDRKVASAKLSDDRSYWIVKFE